MEVAAFLADKAESLSVVDIIKVPFQLVLGEKVGSVLQKVSHDPLQYLMAWWLAKMVPVISMHLFIDIFFSSYFL
jgi:hypothetical protein